MGRVNLGPTTVRVRQVYARHGHSYCVLGIPAGLLRHLGWKPGEIVVAYPTKDGGLKYKAMTGMLAEAGADYDPEFEHPREELKGPRPGSVAAREVEVEAELEAMIERVRGTGKGTGKGKGEEEEEERTTAAGTSSKRAGRRKK